MKTKNFSIREFECKCGCGTNGVTFLLMTNLQKIRDTIKQKLFVNSGVRCQMQNEYVGGAKNSFHVKGMAADLRPEKISPNELYNVINELFPNSYGLIVYDTFVHFDTRLKRYRDDRRTKK